MLKAQIFFGSVCVCVSVYACFRLLKPVRVLLCHCNVVIFMILRTIHPISMKQNTSLNSVKLPYLTLIHCYISAELFYCCGDGKYRSGDLRQSLRVQLYCHLLKIFWSQYAHNSEKRISHFSRA